MPHFLICLLLVGVTLTTAYAQPETPQQSLNQYVAFLNQSVDMLTRRFQMIRAYQAEATQYRKRPDVALTLPSSGPLEAYYYQKAVAGTGLTAAEKQRLTASAGALWQLLTKLDQTGKVLETYVRLNTYADDKFNQSDRLIGDMQALLGQLSRDKNAFYGQIQRIYRRYQPYLPADPYLTTEKEMEQVLLAQQHLLDSLPYYLSEDSRSTWPVALVQQSMLGDEKWLATFGKARPAVAYPASDAIMAFKSAILSMQAVKRRAIDEHTFAARQSARHGNSVYVSLLNQYNQGLLASHRNFVNYSKTARQLLDYPAFSLVFAPESDPPTAGTITRTAPFQDIPSTPIIPKRAATPASRTTFMALNGYVEFINESLRQLRIVQLQLRNYQSSAEHYRDPAHAKQRASLTYAHEDYQVPVSAYQLLLSNSLTIPQPYRTALNNQAEVLLNMLREMDGLSIELIAYTTEKQYLHDQLVRSDAILDRYAYLFAAFDPKKEQLYNDVRRVYDSYPAVAPTSSWYIAGRALLKILDEDKAVLVGIKAYLNGVASQLPPTANVESAARQLVADEYQNLKGLQRYGRSNGLCPYSPYEDLAENSSRFAGMAQKAGTGSSSSTAKPYESFFYFYNNELVYQYNRFSELAKVGLLKAVNQPDVFAFQRLSGPGLAEAAPGNNVPATTALGSAPKPGSPNDSNLPARSTTGQSTDRTTQLHTDTVYIERNRVDTVYVNGDGPRPVIPSLTGFAPNNMVLLLDVSGSMDSPVKLPLLKRSIKSLLTLLRPEDQISIVIYSGKARVVLKPTSGNNKALIARAIDELQSAGDTDANEGLKLAYKVADKNYIRAGNNRIILATDGEFPISNDVLELIGENARQDIYLTVFTFGRNPLTSQNLKKLSQLGHGTYAHVTAETADLQLILEAQARK